MAARLTAYIVASIVSVTFIAGLIVGAQRDTNGPVDLIIVNGRVFTGSEDKLAEAVAIQGNKILRVGTNREIQRMARAQTVVVDARGGSVLPGFNDAHVHRLARSPRVAEVDLLGAGSVEEIASVVRAFARAHPDEPWITGRGWTYEAFPGGLPTRQQLDQMVPDRPAVLFSADGRTAWANTRALKKAGITARTPNPRHGVIVKDPKSGELTGVLEEDAAARFATYLPQATGAERLDAIEHTVAQAHRLGITSLQTIGATEDDLDALDRLRRDGRLSVRVYAALDADQATDADLDRLARVRERFPDDPLLKTGAAALTVDGVIGARTASMLEPYADRGTRGLLRYRQADLDRLVAELDRRRWQVVLQANGDGGVRMALDALERATAGVPPPAAGRRHRVEHIEAIDPEDVPRFAALDVVASVAPFQALPTPGRLTFWTAALGAARASHAWPYGSLAEAGARLVFGSDWPGGSLDPLAALHVAVTRTALDGRPEGGWQPDERLELARAIEAYTSTPAWASFDDQRKGRIEPQMLADIVVLSEDIFALPEERLTEAVVTFTIFDGKVVFERSVETTE